jgi:hypothetical protein
LLLLCLFHCPLFGLGSFLRSPLRLKALVPHLVKPTLPSPPLPCAASGIWLIVGVVFHPLLDWSEFLHCYRSLFAVIDGG